MRRGSLKPAGYRCALPALAVAALALGCQSAPKSEVELARRRAFERRLTQTTQALHAGDLGVARARLDEAKEGATSKRQKQQVESLERLIAGAEALMAGDAELARVEWSRIEDESLKSEVRRKARTVGMSVPSAPVEGEVDS